MQVNLQSLVSSGNVEGFQLLCKIVQVEIQFQRSFSPFSENFILVSWVSFPYFPQFHQFQWNAFGSLERLKPVSGIQLVSLDAFGIFWTERVLLGPSLSAAFPLLFSTFFFFKFRYLRVYRFQEIVIFLQIAFHYTFHQFPRLQVHSESPSHCIRTVPCASLHARQHVLRSQPGHRWLLQRHKRHIYGSVSAMLKLCIWVLTAPQLN